MVEHALNLKENRIVSLDKLTPHPRNYRQHPDGQVSKLVASLARFGQGRSIVVQDGPQGYLIVAGHGIVEAAKKLKYTELRADILPADWSTEQVEGYLVADNLHSQDAEDDETMLATILQEQQDAGFDLASLGTDNETLRQMLESLGDEYMGSGEQDEEEDEIPEVEEEQSRVKLGDIWQLGRHKIACLDSCDPEQVKKLVGTEKIAMVWSDPPYGVEIVASNGFVGGGEAYNIPFGGVKNKGVVGAYDKYIGEKPAPGKLPKKIAKAPKYAPVIGDSSTTTAINAYLLCANLWSTSVQIWWGANYYARALPASSCWLVWDKENNGNFADAELAWCSEKSAVRIFKHMWNGMLKDSEHGQKRVHPTQKPCALFCWCAEKYGKPGDVVFDPFLGSGISVIGCEMLNDGRTVYGCELSPDYVDIVIRRWEAHTGQTATLLERVEEVAHVS